MPVESGASTKRTLIDRVVIEATEVGSQITLPLSSDDIIYDGQTLTTFLNGLAAIPDSADEISYGAGTVEDALDGLLYDGPEILTFTTTTSTYELGATVTAITFNWTRNKSVTSQSLLTPSGTVTLSASQTSYTYTTSFSAGFTFVLTINDGTSSDTANLAINFFNGVYYGTATIPGAVNSAFVTALATKNLSDTKNRSISLNASSGNYYWYAYPTRFGTASFTVGGFAGGFEDAVTVSVTNAEGYNENYYVYRSTNSGQGSNTIVIS